MKLFTRTTANTIFLITVLMMAAAPLMAGGPWTQQKGKGFAQVSFSLIPTYDGIYNSNGDNFTTNRDVSDITTQIYAEYGIAPFLTLSADLPVKFVSTGEDVRNGSFPNTLESGSKNALGNVGLALKAGKRFNSLQAAITLKTELPAGEADAATGLATGVDAFGIAPGISLGTSGEKYYVSGDIGLRFRNNDFSDDFLFAGEAGARVANRFWLVGVLDVRQTITDPANISGNTFQTGLYADGQEWVATGVKVLADINPRFGISLSSFGAFDGNRVASSPSYTLGAFWKF